MTKKQATKAKRARSPDPGFEDNLGDSTEEQKVAPKPGKHGRQTTKAAALEQPEPVAKRRRPEPGSLATKNLEREVYTGKPQNRGGKGSTRNSQRLVAGSKQQGKDPASTKLQGSVPNPKQKKLGAAVADTAERPAAHHEHRWYEQSDDVAHAGASEHCSQQQGGARRQQQQPVQQPNRLATRSTRAAVAKERQAGKTPPSSIRPPSRRKAIMKDFFADEEEAELDSQPPLAAPQQPLQSRQPAGERGTASGASPYAPAARAAGKARPGLSAGAGAGAAAVLAATGTAAAAPGCAASGGAAQRQRSPTPVAAAAVLEVSQPPSPRQDASAEIAEPGGEQVVEEDAVTAAHSLLLSRLRNPRGREALSTQLRPQLQRVHDQMLEYLDNTVELAHNNSVLLLGPRGSGKTLVVERAVGALCAKWNTNPRDPLVGVVRLLGYAHSDDRVAFREIARQLCEEFQYTFSKSVSLKDNIEFLREMLKQLSRAHKAAVFVLEEFDLFAKRTKQAVLYNLLDALVTSGMQAAVIGITTRQDVIEMLEKRVKSRFSHRKLDVVLPTGLAPRQLEGPGGSTVEEDGMLDVLKAMLLLPSSFPDSQHAQRFNRAVEAAVAAPEVAAALGRVMPACPALDDLAIAVESALRASSEGSGLVTARQLVEGLRRLQERQRDMVFAIAQLPVLDLILLAAMQRLVGSGKVDALNFEMAHHEFHLYTSLGGHADKYTKAAAAKAFDHLITQGLVAYVDARNEARGGAARQYAAVYLQVRPQEVEAGMQEHWNCPHNLKAWMTRHGGTGSTAATVLL